MRGISRIAAFVAALLPLYGCAVDHESADFEAVLRVGAEQRAMELTVTMEELYQDGLELKPEGFTALGIRNDLNELIVATLIAVKDPSLCIVEHYLVVEGELAGKGPAIVGFGCDEYAAMFRSRDGGEFSPDS